MSTAHEKCQDCAADNSCIFLDNNCGANCTGPFLTEAEQYNELLRQLRTALKARRPEARVN